jgi:hypothetical protein
LIAKRYIVIFRLYIRTIILYFRFLNGFFGYFNIYFNKLIVFIEINKTIILLHHPKHIKAQDNKVPASIEAFLAYSTDN